MDWRGHKKIIVTLFAACVIVFPGCNDESTDSGDVASDAAEDSGDGPPNTSSARFEGTRCYDQSTSLAEPGGSCSDNRGCLELDVQCGECACTLCADGYCLQAVCDDGGSPECPGDPFAEDAGDGG